MRFKRFTAAALSLAMISSLAACSKEEPADTEEVTESISEVQSETDTESETETEEVTEAKKKALETGDVLVDIDFNDGTVMDFTSYMNGGTHEISNSDGMLDVDIKGCGSLDYANQVYWDGFELVKGAVYTYSFDISSDIDRTVEYRLQLNGGDYHAYQGEYISVGADTLNYSVDFEMTEDSDPAPRIVFNMGYMDDMTEDPGEHHVYIDNIKLVCKDASNAEKLIAFGEGPEVNTNQIGFAPGDDKTVTTADGSDTFEVVDSGSGEAVFSGTFDKEFHDEGSDADVRKGTFSDLKTPGTYYIRTSGGNETYSFEIGDDLYADMYKDVILMLYNQRCGTELKESISGDYAHPACHLEEALVYDEDGGSKESTARKDVSGGWHDAGDYGRYVVSGAMTVQDLFLAYEDYGIDSDDIGIPESGNGSPDILDEAKYELSWMLKMQDEETGGVYHKVTGLVFPGTVMPEEETEQLYLAPISTAATATFAAVMAKASMIYKDIDPSFADKAAAAADKAYEYVCDVQDHTGYKNPSEIVTGEYPDGNTDDEILWAASEMYILKGDERYLNDMENRNNDPSVGLGWADTAGYAMYDVVKAQPKDADDITDQFYRQIIERADDILAASEKDGYNVALGTDYPWGSNLSVAADGDVLLMAYNLSGDEKYEDGARKQLDYLCGNNPLGYCYITGYGTVSPEKPHHRPSQSVGKAMSGMLVGGPDKSLEDPFAAQALSGAAPAKCYADNEQSYSTNEVTIYWNSPLIYLMSAWE